MLMLLSIIICTASGSASIAPNMMKQTKPLTNEAPDRLSVVLQNPSSEWSDIRAAMRAQGGGCTNLAVMNALSSKGGEQNDKSDNTNGNRPMRPKYIEPTVSADDDGLVAAKEKASEGGDDTLMPLGHRRASVASQDSSSGSTRSSLRPLRRQTSRRRMRRAGSRRMSLMRSSVNTSLRSLTLDSLAESGTSGSLHNSSSDFNNSSSFKLDGLGFKDSVNIMDFGISHSRLRAALDGSDRSCSSLDTGALDDLQEEYDDDGDVPRSRSTLLVSWQHDSSMSGGDGDFQGNRRNLLLRHDSTISGLDESVRSEGDLDTYVDSSGFLDWPEAKKGEGEGGSDANKTGEDADKASDVEEIAPTEDETDELIDQLEVEEWNIEDYEGGVDSDQDQKRYPRAHSISTSTMGLAVTNTFMKFTRRGSNASSNGSEEDMDLLKIKEALPTFIAKNRQQNKEVDNTAGKKKRAGSMSVMSMFQSSMEAELKRKPPAAEAATRRMSRKEVIWAKDSVNKGSCDEYKKLYAPAPKMAPQRKSWNIFERVKGDTFDDDFSRRSSD